MAFLYLKKRVTFRVSSRDALFDLNNFNKCIALLNNIFIHYREMRALFFINVITMRFI